MNHSRAVCVAMTAILASAVAASGGEITIAENGEAKLKIVVGAETSETVRRAARDLSQVELFHGWTSFTAYRMYW